MGIGDLLFVLATPQGRSVVTERPPSPFVQTRPYSQFHWRFLKKISCTSAFSSAFGSPLTPKVS